MQPYSVEWHEERLAFWRSEIVHRTRALGDAIRVKLEELESAMTVAAEHQEAIKRLSAK